MLANSVQDQSLPRLRQSHALSPVTALAFYDAGPDRVWLLAGEDTWFKVYDPDSSRLLGQLRVFGSQPIHGIYVSQSDGPADEQAGVLIWGGHSVTVLPRAALQALVRGTPHGARAGAGAGAGLKPREFTAPDWIYDGILFPESPCTSSLSPSSCENGNSNSPRRSRTRTERGALVTAHNEILPVFVRHDPKSATATETVLTFGPLASPSRPILYSANLALLSPGVLLVAGGTVFGEIIVWKYHYSFAADHGGDGDGDDDEVRQDNGRRAMATAAAAAAWCEVCHVLTGHEGSIFGVCISPEMELGLGVVPPSGGTAAAAAAAAGDGKGKRGRLLASCSDDRTVRVWDLSGGPCQLDTAAACSSALDSVGAAAAAVDGGRGTGLLQKALAEARETGFGGERYSSGPQQQLSEDAVDGAHRRRNGGDDAARCVAVAMGHVSRIWHVRFGRRVGRRLEVCSFGEDCSRQSWELDLDPERWEEQRSATGGEPGALGHCGASTCHSGKNIWSAAVLARGDDELLIATGGADGKVVISGKVGGAGPSADGRYEDLDISLTFDQLLRSLQSSTQSSPIMPQTKASTKHAFQRYAFLSDRVMAATASGRLFLCTMGDPVAWEEVALPEVAVSDLKSYCVVKSPAKDTALLGSASGSVYLFRRGHDVREIVHLPEKISDIILLDNHPSHPSGSEENCKPWSVIITVLGLDHCFLLHFDPSTATPSIDQRKIRLPEHYIVTAAAFCEATLILGSRTGAVTLYTTDPATNDFVPLTSRRDCRTKDAVTCILPIPGRSEQSSSASFLTTCRDGKYRIYTLPSPSHSSGPSIALALQHEISPPLNTLEAAFLTSPRLPTSPSPSYITKSELILHGFRGPEFLAYNATTRAVLASIPCGGAHRPFASASRARDPGQLRFVFSRAGELRVVSQGRARERILRAGGHGREVKAVAASRGQTSRFPCFKSSPLPLSPSPLAGGPADNDVNANAKGEEEAGEGGGAVLIATAAEDTSIRIWRHQQPRTLSDDGETHDGTTTNATAITATTNTAAAAEEMECLAVVEGHSAGIQTLRWLGRDRLVSSAGSEELFVWRVSRVASAAYDALAVVREAVWDDRSAERDLRIVDFDVAPFPLSSSSSPEKIDGDGDGGGGAMLISMVLSDSSVRCYVYTPPPPPPPPQHPQQRECPDARGQSGEAGPKFTLLASGRYTGACPTQVRHLRADAATNAAPHVLTAFTDGHLAVWKPAPVPPAEYQAHRRRDHQSGPSPSELVPALVVRLHQNSIKSLDLRPLRPNASTTTTNDPRNNPRRWLVITGGDDNALGFLDLAWDARQAGSRGGGGYAVVGRYRISSAHAAAVTGVAVVDNDNDNDDDDDDDDEGDARSTDIVTVSNDQRIKLWRAERLFEAGSAEPGSAGGRLLRVVLLDDRYSSVADAGDLELIAPGKLVVGGVGMEVWSLVSGGSRGPRLEKEG